MHSESERQGGGKEGEEGGGRAELLVAETVGGYVRAEVGLVVVEVGRVRRTAILRRTIFYQCDIIKPTRRFWSIPSARSPVRS